MKNRTVKTRKKYERKLEKLISKSGGISIKNDEVNIDYISIAEPKGLYAVDNFDIDFVVIEMIMQEVATGKVMALNEEFGMMAFDFDFVGSKEECYKFILDTKESNAQEVAELHLTINTVASAE